MALAYICAFRVKEEIVHQQSCYLRDTSLYSFLGSYHMCDSIFQRSIGPVLSEGSELYIKTDSYFPGAKLHIKT